jgi:hypothetical protein
MSNRSYAQIRVDNLVWAIKELRRNYVVARDETFTALEYTPKDEKLTDYVTKFDGAVEALDHLLVIINNGK